MKSIKRLFGYFKNLFKKKTPLEKFISKMDSKISELKIDAYKYSKGLRNANCRYAKTKGFTIH